MAGNAAAAKLIIYALQPAWDLGFRKAVLDKNKQVGFSVIEKANFP